jgi:uncharacterized protein YegL
MRRRLIITLAILCSCSGAARAWQTSVDSLRDARSLGDVVADMARGSQPQEGVHTLRVVCLDKSGSMRGDDGGEQRLARAVKEVKEIASSPPASGVAPVVIVYFTNQADEPRSFTEPAALVRFLDGLSADGGTSIADGLRKTITVLEQHERVEQLYVFLITDGEDNDLSGIEQAQGKLNKLFKARRQKQLSNAVFVRAWSPDVKEKLTGPIVAGGAATLIDMATAKRVPVAVEATVRAGAPQWLHPGATVRLPLFCKAETRGNSAVVRSPVTLIPNRGQDRILLMANAAESRVEIDVPITADEVASGGLIGIELAVTVPRLEAFSAQGAYELLPGPEKVKIEFALPPLRLELKIVARPASSCRWVSLGDDRVEAEVNLDWEARGSKVVQPTECRLDARGGASIVRGERFEVAGDRGSTVLVISASQPTGTSRRYAVYPAASAVRGLTVLTSPFDVDVTAPAPLALRAALANQANDLPVIEGKVTSQTSSISHRIRVVHVNNAPSDLLGSLKLEPRLTVNGVTSLGSQFSVADDPNGQPIKFDLPGTPGFWRTERIDAEVSLRPLATSVTVRPVKLVIFREPWSTTIVTVLMAGAAAVAVGLALAKVLRSTAGKRWFVMVPHTQPAPIERPAGPRRRR